MAEKEFQILVKHYDETINTVSLTIGQWYDFCNYMRSIGVPFEEPIKPSKEIETFYGGTNPND